MNIKKKNAIAMHVVVGMTASSALAFGLGCYKQKFICDATGCGQADFTVCDDGYEPGCPGREYSTFFNPMRLTKCVTYPAAMQSVEGGCDAPVPEGYKPANCSNLAAGICCFVDESQNPDPPVVVTDWRWVLVPTGAACDCP